MNLKNFKSKCLEFYKFKTKQRIELFFKKFNHNDEITHINDEKMPKVEDLLESLDWNFLSEGIPSYFHGDFHFENILFNKKTGRLFFLIGDKILHQILFVEIGTMILQN